MQRLDRLNIYRGQHAIEFALLIAIVVAAIAAGGIYIHRSIQAKLKLVELQINNPPTVTITKGVEKAYCGNGTCDPGETYANCHADCSANACVVDGECRDYLGEDSKNCPDDCKQGDGVCDYCEYPLCDNVGGSYCLPPTYYLDKDYCGPDAHYDCKCVTCGDGICSGNTCNENYGSCQLDCAIGS